MFVWVEKIMKGGLNKVLALEKDVRTHKYWVYTG